MATQKQKDEADRRTRYATSDARDDLTEPKDVAPKPVPVTVVETPVPSESAPPAPLPSASDHVAVEADRKVDKIEDFTIPDDLSPDQEIALLEERIAFLRKRADSLRHPFIEFPKMVKGRTFASREEQDKAGPDYADK